MAGTTLIAAGAGSEAGIVAAEAAELTAVEATAEGGAGILEDLGSVSASTQGGPLSPNPASIRQIKALADGTKLTPEQIAELSKNVDAILSDHCLEKRQLRVLRISSTCSRRICVSDFSTKFRARSNESMMPSPSMVRRWSDYAKQAPGCFQPSPTVEIHC